MFAFIKSKTSNFANVLNYKTQIIKIFKVAKVDIIVRLRFRSGLFDAQF